MAFANIESLEKRGRIDALARIAGRKRDVDAPAAMEALGRIASTEAVRVLLRLCKHNDIRVWQKAKEVLAGIDNPLAIPVLLDAIASGQYDVAAPAILALSHIDSIEALEALVKTLKNEKLAPEVLKVLKGRKEPIVAQALCELLEERIEQETTEQPGRDLLWNHSICKEILALFGAMQTVEGLRALHGFLRCAQQAPQRLRLQTVKALMGYGLAGYQVIVGYIGENMQDSQRLHLLLQCLPEENAVQVLLQNMQGKAADDLGQAIIACFSVADTSLWPHMIEVLARIDRDGVRTALLMWFVQIKAASREAGFVLANHGDTRPILVKRLVDMVQHGEKDTRINAGGLLKSLYEEKRIGEEGVLLVRAKLDDEGNASDYEYIGPDI